MSNDAVQPNKDAGKTELNLHEMSLSSKYFIFISLFFLGGCLEDKPAIEPGASLCNAETFVGCTEEQKRMIALGGKPSDLDRLRLKRSKAP